MYKGYPVRERILKDYEHPKTAVLVEAPCGCDQCNEAGKVQPGHEQCGVIPDVLAEDDNVHSFLEDGFGWLLEFTGPNEHVDEWLETA